jgi:hypothetical protein
LYYTLYVLSTFFSIFLSEIEKEMERTAAASLIDAAAHFAPLWHNMI